MVPEFNKYFAMAREKASNDPSTYPSEYLDLAYALVLANRILKQSLYSNGARAWIRTIPDAKREEKHRISTHEWSGSRKLSKPSTLAEGALMIYGGSMPRRSV